MIFYHSYPFKILWNKRLCKKIPNWAGLIQGPINLDCRSTRGWAWYWACRVAIAKNSSGGENLVGESCGNHNVIVPSRLIRSYQHWIRLSYVNVKRRVRRLYGVCSFHFHQLHFVVLNAKVKGMFQPHIWYSQPVSFSCSGHHKHNNII